MTELELYRKKIDEIDRELADLFCRRMEIVKGIACYKKAAGLPICDATREETMKANLSASFEKKDLLPYYQALLEKLLELSKAYQKNLEDGEA